MLQLDGVECCLFAGFHKNKYLRDASSEVKKHIIGWYLPPQIVMQRFFMPMNRFLFQVFAKNTSLISVTIHTLIHQLFLMGVKWW